MSRQRVVFVCEHGAVKSVIAREHFNRLARARGLEIDAIARGTEPDSEIPESVLHGLGDDGFDVDSSPPQHLDANDLRKATLVVSFDADVTAMVGGAIGHEKWDGLPSAKADYVNGKAPIVALVEHLVDRLDGAQSRR